ncbi:MAG: ThuA domain-containing protein [Thermoguttaceae bacterium]
MKCIITFVALLGLMTALLAAADGAESGKLRILLTTGGHAFEVEPFYQMFDAMKGIETTKAEMPKDAGLLRPGLEKDFYCIVMYDMCKPAISPEQQQAFVKLLTETGIGLVSMHHNLGANATWDEFRKIIGGRFILSDSEIDGVAWKKTRWEHDHHLKVTVVDKEHPITRGVGDFEIDDEAYGKFWVDPEAHILLKTDHAWNNPELAWTKTYGKSRVFHLMLGHDGKAYANPSFQRVLEQGIRWAAAGQ